MIRQVTINGKTIEIDTDRGKCFKEFLDPIHEYLVYKNRVLVVLNYMDYSKALGNRNVLCLDAEGNTLWRVEDPLENKKVEADPFVGVHLSKEGAVRVFTWGGYSYVLDIETGKVSHAKFVK